MLEDFLPLVTKPARYINSEINSIHKDLSRVRTKVCLFFPDTYEVGMSHLGLRILYDILNKRDDTACERVFSPWTDYEEKLRAAGKPLRSIESNLPLSEFDIIGVTLQYELSYTNILTGLDLARIPLHSAKRTDSHPIIIAGGPCAVNPEPLADFIDIFFIGEAEEAIHELIDMKQKYPGRQQFLDALAKIDGFYVPAFGAVPVRRRYLANMESASYPERPLVPLMKPVHDRITVEVARGCIRGCRFCQAGIIYRPFRERSPARVKHILAESLSCTGYEELSLASLSSGDYSSIEPLIIELMKTYRERRVSVSLPSLRVGTLTPAVIEAIASTRKTGFTLAPEAGTERLRRVINKPVSNADLLGTAETVFANGWNVLKVYFMIGLPTETDEDLDGIIKLGHELLARSKRFSKRRVQINISVSSFVPKPHTPFQWIGQAPFEEIRRKQAYLDKGLRRRGLNVKFHDAEMSLLEAAFARGDRAVGQVIEEAWRRGCRFDGWSDRFNFRKWEGAFAALGLKPRDYADRTLAIGESLPWDHIKTGVTKTFLQNEFKRAEAAEITGNCRSECARCGMGCEGGGNPSFGSPASIKKGELLPNIYAKSITLPAQEITTRVRMKYTKTGRVRFLSHLDFMTLFQRAAVRAGVPIAFSRGFNPHPKMAFGPALPVSIESESEYLDIEVDPFVDLLKMTKNLNDTLPPGIRIVESRIIPGKCVSLSGSIRRYDYSVQVPSSQAAGLEERAARFLAKSAVVITGGNGPKNIRSCIESLIVEKTAAEAALRITLQDKDPVRPRVQDVITQCFEIGRDDAARFRIKRTGMYCWNGATWTSPMEV